MHCGDVELCPPENAFIPVEKSVLNFAYIELFKAFRNTSLA